MIPDIQHLPMNPSLRGQAEVLRHIRYSENGQELTLILPWAPMDDRSRREPSPLILFVQGSAWGTPNIDYEIPMLSHFAEEGITVASISHRSIRDGFRFPAFLQDAKCAVRFLRANAAKYAVDPSRIAAFGTSSGGNTVCLMGLLGDDPELRTEEYADQSDAVCAVVSCFAPTDLPALFAALKDVPGIEQTMAACFGPDPDLWQRHMEHWSPALRVRKDTAYPPFLLLHGTEDPVVPCGQMDSFYTALKSAGTEVEAFYVDGAEHEGNFWGEEVRRIIHDKLARRLGIV